MLYRDRNSLMWCVRSSGERAIVVVLCVQGNGCGLCDLRLGRIFERWIVAELGHSEVFGQVTFAVFADRVRLVRVLRASIRLAGMVVQVATGEDCLEFLLLFFICSCCWRWATATSTISANRETASLKSVILAFSSPSRRLSSASRARVAPRARPPLRSGRWHPLRQRGLFSCIRYTHRHCRR